VLTATQVKAAPVILVHERLKAGKARAVIVNAGNANACTGEAGIRDAYRTAELVAEALKIPAEQVLVASTGVIGEPLNMGAIETGISELANNLQPRGLPQAAKAIMTTDSFPKLSQFKGSAGGKEYHILGIAKGAGMIMPQMATMLGFILSDICINLEDLKAAVKPAVDETFNRISVDGDTSTNDMVLVLANGKAENGPLLKEDLTHFKAGLKQVMADLAKMIVTDGEGATKVVRVILKGARSASEALQGLRTVANSSLVKTAFYGQDPNWGRIMAALGRSGISMQENQVDIWVEDIQIVSKGLAKGAEAEKEAARKMKEKEFDLVIHLHQGSFEDEMLTCDLTHDYVSINADYRS
jgi:glutamate N-acetyltransferase/amino-acid N-acetyltransferase